MSESASKDEAWEHDAITLSVEVIKLWFSVVVVLFFQNNTVTHMLPYIILNLTNTS